MPTSVSSLVDILTNGQDENHSVNAVCSIGENHKAHGRPQEGYNVPEAADIDA